MSTHRFGLISDTHGSLHPAVFDLFAGAVSIFHAGDVCDERILDELGEVAPVWAVQGNCDMSSPRLPPLRVLDAPFGRVVISHSHLVASAGMGHPRLLVQHFHDRNPRLIVYGHTHKQFLQEIDGIWVVNPGPAGKPRLRDKPTVVTLDYSEESGAMDFAFHDLDWGRPRNA